MEKIVKSMIQERIKQQKETRKVDQI